MGSSGLGQILSDRIMHDAENAIYQITHNRREGGMPHQTALENWKSDFSDTEDVHQ